LVAGGGAIPTNVHHEKPLATEIAGSKVIVTDAHEAPGNDPASWQIAAADENSKQNKPEETEGLLSKKHMARSVSPKKSLPEKHAAPVKVEDTLTREIALLDAGRKLLATNPAEALNRFEEHAREFPRGSLGTEREFLAMEALRRLGRSGEARARGAALLDHAKGSPYETKVRRKLDDTWDSEGRK
jgi:hypothetical protein